MRQLLFLGGLIALMTPTLLHAEKIDLQSAIQRAIKDRPPVHLSQEKTEIAVNVLREARSSNLPRISFSETFSMTNEPAGSLFIALNQERNVMTSPAYNLVDPATQNDFETRLTLEQSLFDPARIYRINGAEKRLDASRSRQLWSQESAAFFAFQAYLGVQKADSEAGAAKSALAEGQEVLRLAKERYQAGIGLKVDELRAQNLRAETERRALTAQNNLTIAQRRLALAIGQSEGEVEIYSPLDDSLFTSHPVTAPQERADLQAAALEVEAVALSKKEGQAAYLPRVDVAASYGIHNESSPFGTDGQAWRVGAILNWEIFDGFRRNAAVARAAAEERAAAAGLSEARREQNFRRQEVRLRIEEARQQKESTTQGLAVAEESYRLLQQRYENGLSDLSELLGAQTALDLARSALVNSETQLLFYLGQSLLEEGRFLSTFTATAEVSQ